jgi:hypothetical protein
LTVALSVPDIALQSHKLSLANHVAHFEIIRTYKCLNILKECQTGFGQHFCTFVVAEYRIWIEPTREKEIVSGFPFNGKKKWLRLKQIIESGVLQVVEENKLSKKLCSYVPRIPIKYDGFITHEPAGTPPDFQHEITKITRYGYVVKAFDSIEFDC